MVGMLRGSSTDGLVQDKAIYDTLIGWRPVRWSQKVAWEPNEIKYKINVWLFDLKAEEVAGHWDVNKVRSCYRRGRTRIFRRTR